MLNNILNATGLSVQQPQNKSEVKSENSQQVNKKHSFPDIQPFKLLIRFIHPDSILSSRHIPTSRSLSNSKTDLIKSIHQLFMENPHQLNINAVQIAYFSKMGIRNFDNMENQDAMLIDHVSNKCKIVGVFDGHGEHGKMIAKTASSVFKNFLKKYSQDFKAESAILEIQTIVKKTLEKTNNYLLHYKVGEAQFSGTTALISLITNKKIYVFNIGNSRAVIGKEYPIQGVQGGIIQKTSIVNRNKQMDNSLRIDNSSKMGNSTNIGNSHKIDNSLLGSQQLNKRSTTTIESFQLTHDQTINRFDERLRIIESGGMVTPYKSQLGQNFGPQRIWVKGEKYPGTFITRALGLSCSYKIGVTSQPQVNIINYNKSLKYLVLATDGFWAVFQNDQAIKWIDKYGSKEKLKQGVEGLMEEATRRWKEKRELMDDMTVIVVALH